MKWLVTKFDEALDWIQLYGWVILVLGLGILIGLALFIGSDWLQAFSYLGTFGAAVAAFFAVAISSRDQRRRHAQEEEARRPYVVVSDADFNVRDAEHGAISITFANLSQYPIHIRDAVVWSDEDHPEVMVVGLLIMASQTAIFNSFYNVNLRKEGGLIFLFHYAPTGPVLHSLALPYRRSFARRALDDGIPDFRYTEIFFQVEDQVLKTNVKDEAKEVREFVAEMHAQQDL